MTKKFLLGLMTASLLSIGSAWAATPFGGDDQGFIPPDSTTQKCEAKIGKTASKFIKCVDDCHVGRAKGKYGDPTSEDGCESICEGKFDIAIGKLTKAGCPPPCSSPLSLRGAWKAFLNGNNNQVFCENTTPFGGDDSGSIPSTTVIAKCEGNVLAQGYKFVSCIMKCHDNRSKNKTDATGEETCEGTCRTTYNNKILVLNGKCPIPGCVNTATYADNLHTTTDNNNGLIYCAQ